MKRSTHIHLFWVQQRRPYPLFIRESERFRHQQPPDPFTSRGRVHGEKVDIHRVSFAMRAKGFRFELFDTWPDLNISVA